MELIGENIKEIIKETITNLISDSERRIIDSLRGEINSKIDSLRGEINSKIDSLRGDIVEIKDRVSILESENRRMRFSGFLGAPGGFGPEAFHGVSKFNSISDPDIEDIPLEFYK